jgi:hypothetical protein
LDSTERRTERPAGALDREVWLTRLSRKLARDQQTTRVRIARELICSIRPPGASTSSSANSPSWSPTMPHSCWTSAAAAR